MHHHHRPPKILFLAERVRVTPLTALPADSGSAVLLPGVCRPILTGATNLPSTGPIGLLSRAQGAVPIVAISELLRVRTARARIVVGGQAGTLDRRYLIIFQFQYLGVKLYRTYVLFSKSKIFLYDLWTFSGARSHAGHPI